MYPITSRRWFYPLILALSCLAEIWLSRLSWRTDTQSDAKLRQLQVRSGYELVLENGATKNRQPILSYNASAKHDHRVYVDLHSAHLSPESFDLLALASPPKTPGRLIYAPDADEAKSAGPPCRAALRVEFPSQQAMHARSVAIAPARAEDVFDRSSSRLVHLTSDWPLTIRVSASSQDGASGPGCHNLLSIGNWQQVVGKDFELAFTTDPKSPIELALSSPSFQSGLDELESLEIESLLPYRLSTRPSGQNRIVQSRIFAGKPPLTLTDLRLAGDFFDVELTGRAGVPIPEFLGWKIWPILAAVDLPLLVLSIQVFRLRRTVFLSYSRADRERVMAIYQRLKDAGLDVWIDQQLEPGVDWEEMIRAQMLKARRIVVFLSHSVNDGGFVMAELALARAVANDRAKRGTFIIPVRLEPCPIPRILEPWNALDLFEPDGERHLLAALGSRVLSAIPVAPPASAAGAAGSTT